METNTIKKQTLGILKMMNLILLLILFQTIYATCPIQSPNFTTSVNGNTVTFVLQGGGYNSYIIGYGDVTYGTSLTHTYSTSGIKTVCVRFNYVDSLNTANSCDTTICKNIEITNVPFNCPIQNPSFSAQVSGSTVTLTKGGSGYNSFQYIYGDGTGGTSDTHTYPSSPNVQTFTVCLKLSYIDSTNTSRYCDTTICQVITITPSGCNIVNPNFTTSVNGNTLTIALSGTGYNTYIIGYGDATYGSSLTHTYSTSGVKTVCVRFIDSLNASGPCDTTICKTITIANNFVCPIQGIYFAVTINGNTVKLTKYGTGYTSYLWTYGDGSSGLDSIHTYTSSGIKTICLKYIFNTPNGTCDTTYCKTITIAPSTFVCPIANPQFSAVVNGNTVTLTKSGTGYNSFQYIYGDGTSGTSNTHTYATNPNFQTFTVCLKLSYIDSTNTSRYCDTTICQVITISPTVSNCPIRNANFTAIVNGNSVTLSMSGSGYNNYLWNYGDGSSGTANSHTYTTPGQKTICINFRYIDSSNTPRSCDTTVCKTITIQSSGFNCPIRDIYFYGQINGNTVTLTKFGSGYTQYQWNYGDGTTGTSNTHTYTSPGVKTICLKYFYVDSTNTSRHCDTTYCKTFTISTPVFTCNLQNVNFTVDVTNDTVYLNKSGSGYTSYIWNYGDGQYGTDNFHIYNSNGVKTVCIKFIDSTSAGVCDTIICNTFTITAACDSVSCVLPGDADHDFTVNNFDIFAIGLSYNRQGPARPNATTQYTLQPAPDWTTNSYYVFNDKFSDCNGNGIINNADGSVILQNYIAKPFNQFNHRQGSLDSLPPVYLAFDSLPVFQIGNPCNTTEIVSDINVGSSSHNAENVYGIGFSVDYPASFATDSCFRIQVDLDADSWFATNEPVLYLVKNLPQFNRVDIGIARTSGTTRSGNGRIGKIKFVVEDGIFIYGRSSSEKKYTFSVTNVGGVDNRGYNIALNGLSSEATFIISGNKNNKIEKLRIYPNPAQDVLTVSAGEKLETAVVIDISGQLIKLININSYDGLIDVSDLSEGMYLIEVHTANAVNTSKFIKAK